MIPALRDLRALRAEHEKLSKRIAHLARLRLLLLALFVLTVYAGFVLAMFRAVLGKITLEPSEWPAALPYLALFLTLTQLHQHILRKKRQLLEQVAAHLIRARSAETWIVDRLWFAEGAPGGDRFVRHPAHLAGWLEFAGIVGFFAALFALAPATTGDLGGVCLAGVLCAYLAIYGRVISQRLEAQVAATCGFEVPPTWVKRWWEGGQRWARRQLARTRPRLSLAGGALMILVTLYLATGVGSCGTPKPGYTIFTGKSDWPSAEFVDEPPYLFFKPAIRPLTRGIYGVSLLLAATTSVLLVVSILRPQVFAHKNLVAGLFVLSGTLSFFTLGDYATIALYPFASWAFQWVVWWLVPLAVWLWFRFSRSESQRARWQVIRSRLVALYLPALACDVSLLALAIAEEFYGVVSFFFGIHLLTIGYMRLAAPAAAPFQEAEGPRERENEREHELIAVGSTG